MRVLRRGVRWSLVVALAVAACAVPALGAFPDDPPDDPEFALAERSCSTHSVNEEQYYLYSTMSACTPFATDPERAAGMSVDRAWREATPGRPDVVIAYVEAGVNWFEPGARDIADQIHLNTGELPPPTTPKDDGRRNVEDYADTPDANGNGYVDAEDLIVRFSDGADDDGNGYVDDVSGWDTHDGQNDPATVDGAYTHANAQMRQAAAEADNGLLGAGVCPGCSVLPIRAGAEALDRTDDLAEAWQYALDAGADVIVSVTADLGYSSFMRQVVEEAWRRGVVMVQASNDFNSTDHQGGMFWPHVLPGNGFTTDTNGLPGPAANALTRTFRARSGLTSWGTHNMFTVSTRGGSTSTSTPTLGGAAALVLSAGLEAADRGVGPPLSGPEAVQVLRATASDVTHANWPARPGWDLQFGYGRPNLARAARAVLDGDVPPVGWIDKPDWYALFDPTRQKAVDVTGHVEAPRAGGYRWELRMAPGAEPADADFVPVGSGAGSAPYDGSLGTVDLGAIPASFWGKAFRISTGRVLETNEQYTVTLRLRVFDDRGRMGEERRAIAVHHDPSWRAGFPQRIGPGGEAQPQLADLQGTGRLAAVFGDADGVVHAIDAVTGAELPGWPRRTRATDVTRPHDGVDPGHEPVIASVAIGDLDGRGVPSVVVTSTTGRVYAFASDGAPRRGWPQALDAGVVPPPIPRPNRPFTRDPVMGATAPPVLVDLAGDARPEVVQAGWDGRLHAWSADGAPVPGWPVEVVPPAGGTPAGYVRIADHKLDTPPAVADLDGDGRMELVVRSQWQDVRGADLQPLAKGFVHAYRADGTPVPRWPIRLPALAAYYGSAQEFVTEGAHVPAAADVDGDGADEVVLEGMFSPPVLVDGDGRTIRTLGVVTPTLQQLLEDPATWVPRLDRLDDAYVGFTTSGAFGRIGDRLVYTESGSGALSIAGSLLFTGSGRPLRNVLRAFNARTGGRVPGFPRTAQGLNFLGGVLVADVSGDGRPELLQGGDTSALHAYELGGLQAPSFPKFHTGWMLYAPTAGDVDGDGRTDLVAMTREGYLMAWRTEGLAASNREWWSHRHDERNTSRYGADTRPPAAVRAGRLREDGRRLQLVAPGDDWSAGRVARYAVTITTARGTQRITRRARARAGRLERLRLPVAARAVRVQAIDDAGNRGAPVLVRRR